MAEERIIDDDINKDKKYRIVTGEDGEDELVINEGYDEEAEENAENEDLGFDAPAELIEGGEDGELTAEQYEAAMILKREEEARRKKALEELREKVKVCLENEQYSDVLDCVDEAEELEPEDGEFLCVKLEALTRKFTDFSDAKAVTEAARQVSEEASAEHRARLYGLYNDLIESARAENAERLRAVNEKYAAEQQSRRAILAPRKKKALTNFIIVLAVFAVFLVAAIVCSTMMFSSTDGVMLIVTIVLAAIAFAALVALIFVTRTFVNAARMLAANEKDKSTKLGRERRDLAAYGETLKAVSIAIAPENTSAGAGQESNDIS